MVLPSVPRGMLFRTQSPEREQEKQFAVHHASSDLQKGRKGKNKKVKVSASGKCSEKMFQKIALKKKNLMLGLYSITGQPPCLHEVAFF